MKKLISIFIALIMPAAVYADIAAIKQDNATYIITTPIVVGAGNYLTISGTTNLTVQGTLTLSGTSTVTGTIPVTAVPYAATLTGTQTLTHKTIADPVLTGTTTGLNATGAWSATGIYSNGSSLYLSGDLFDQSVHSFASLFNATGGDTLYAHKSDQSFTGFFADHPVPVSGTSGTFVQTNGATLINPVIISANHTVISASGNTLSKSDIFAGSILSLDWGNRQLYASDGTTSQLDWSSAGVVSTPGEFDANFLFIGIGGISTSGQVIGASFGDVYGGLPLPGADTRWVQSGEDGNTLFEGASGLMSVDTLRGITINDASLGICRMINKTNGTFTIFQSDQNGNIGFGDVNAGNQVNIAPGSYLQLNGFTDITLNGAGLNQSGGLATYNSGLYDGSAGYVNTAQTAVNAEFEQNTGYPLVNLFNGAQGFVAYAGQLNDGSNNNISGDGSGNYYLASGATFSPRLRGYTVSALPASPAIGDMAYVTDATAPTYNSILVGGGISVVPVFYNGTAWVSH